MKVSRITASKLVTNELVDFCDVFVEVLLGNLIPTIDLLHFFVAI